MRKKRNFSRLYAVARAKGVDLELHKQTLVTQFTGGRTTSLREMTPAEYDALCDCLQTGRPPGELPETYRERLRKARSAALNRMQRLGVDTADRTFAAVDAFCRSPRIAGKPFGLLTVEELQALVPKLEAILRKPKPVKQPQPSGAPQPSGPAPAPAQPELPQPETSAEPARQACGSPKPPKPETGKPRPAPAPAQPELPQPELPQPELPQPETSAEPARQAGGGPKLSKPQTGKPRPAPAPAQPELPQPETPAEPARQAGGSPKPPAAKGCPSVCDLPAAPSRTSDCNPRRHSKTAATAGSSGPRHSAHPGTDPQTRPARKPAEAHPCAPAHAEPPAEPPAEEPGPAAPQAAAEAEPAEPGPTAPLSAPAPAQPATAQSAPAQPKPAKRRVIPLLLRPDRPPS